MGSRDEDLRCCGRDGGWLEPVRLAAGLALRPDEEIVTVCIVEPRTIAYGMGTGTGPVPSGMFLDTTPGRATRELMGEVDADFIILPATQPRACLEALIFGDPWGPAIAAVTVPVLFARPGRPGPPCSVLLIPALTERRPRRSRDDGDDGRWPSRAPGSSTPETVP